eukprot:3562500-Rhodomonas_salina.1
MQNTAFLVQTLLRLWFLAFDFGARGRGPETCSRMSTANVMSLHRRTLSQYGTLHPHALSQYGTLDHDQYGTWPAVHYLSTYIGLPYAVSVRDIAPPYAISVRDIVS